MTKQLRTADGKRLRSTHEWLRAQGDAPVTQFRMFDPEDEIVLEGWKNVNTKARIVTKIRRPVGAELEEFRRKGIEKGMELHNAKRTREIEDRLVAGRKAEIDRRLQRP